jgi:alkylation response protein AidB-like acyl-CoA dehydrogenase
VRFELTAEQRRWQEEVRTFLEETVDDDLRRHVFEGRPIGDEQHEPVDDFYRQLADRGWQATNWPAEYGGRQMTTVERLILIDELDNAGAPRLEFTVTGLAPIIIRHGTEANKRMWLDKIRNHEVSLALGYSEPEAGTDLANLQTRAVLDGDEWVINGTKIWNSGAHHATHEWMAVRTDPSLPRHKGISLIIVPLDAGGIEVQPIWTWGGVRTNQTWFNDVRVPRDHLIGEVNRGWDYIVGALDYERVSIGFCGSLRRFLDRLIEHCKTTTLDGEVLINRPEVRTGLAELQVEVDVVNLMSLDIASQMDQGVIPTVTATAQKIMTTELRTRLADFAMQIHGVWGLFDRSDPRAPLGGDAELLYRVAPMFRFGGGANEVMRDIVAQRGAGLPRGGRRTNGDGRRGS